MIWPFLRSIAQKMISPKNLRMLGFCRDCITFVGHICSVVIIRRQSNSLYSTLPPHKIPPLLVPPLHKEPGPMKQIRHPLCRPFLG